MLQITAEATAPAGLPVIRFHDLRHTAASLMLNHGIPVIVVSRRLGHAKPSITLDVYGHLLPSLQEEAAQKIDELITPVEFYQQHHNCTKKWLRDDHALYMAIKKHPPHRWGQKGGRNRTRTCALLCVSHSWGLSTVSTPYIWHIKSVE